MKITAPLAKPLVALLALLLCAASPFAWAEKADRNQPMNIEADALRYDDVKQLSVFTGNVVITKGSMIIRGTRIEVRQDPQGFQFGVAIGGAGKLAYFRQKRDGVDEAIEGEGETIEYDGKADVVKFVKRAVIRRFRGATLADETTGALITYDNTTDVFSVDGGASNASPGNPTGRIRAVLTPRGVTPAAAAASSAAPAAPLRPSTTLGGDKK
jgi:lipopolysaccharide export system protein LptA